MAGIFISYRRTDGAPYAGRIYDHLCNHFGAQSVFMDIDTIRPGADFVSALETAVGICSALVVVVGKQWASLADSEGHRRLDDPDDFVRLEVAAALGRNILVIPVLVDGAQMPAPEQLPPPLVEFSRRNALFISNERFSHDMSRLINAIQTVMPRPAQTAQTMASQAPVQQSASKPAPQIAPQPTPQVAPPSPSQAYRPPNYPPAAAPQPYQQQQPYYQAAPPRYPPQPTYQPPVYQQPMYQAPGVYPQHPSISQRIYPPPLVMSNGRVWGAAFLMALAGIALGLSVGAASSVLEYSYRYRYESLDASAIIVAMSFTGAFCAWALKTAQPAVNLLQALFFAVCFPVVGFFTAHWAISIRSDAGFVAGLIVIFIVCLVGLGVAQRWVTRGVRWWHTPLCAVVWLLALIPAFGVIWVTALFLVNTSSSNYQFWTFFLLALFGCVFGFLGGWFTFWQLQGIQRKLYMRYHGQRY